MAMTFVSTDFGDRQGEFERAAAMYHEDFAVWLLTEYAPEQDDYSLRHAHGTWVRSRVTVEELCEPCDTVSQYTVPADVLSMTGQCPKCGEEVQVWK